MESLTIDYPHGEDRLMLRADGEAVLYYGALPQSQTVENGIFDLEQILEQLKPKLCPNTPREEWDNPNSTAGMVTIRYAGSRSEDVFLIFDQSRFAERLFSKAKRHVVE